jgi:hypothetical protein
MSSNMLRCGPSTDVAKSAGMMLADARDSQAWASRSSVLMSGGLGLGLVKLLDQGSRYSSLLNGMGGDCTRVSRPGIKEPGAPKCPTHSHHNGVTLARLEIDRAARPDR